MLENSKENSPKNSNESTSDSSDETVSRPAVPLIMAVLVSIPISLSVYFAHIDLQTDRFTEKIVETSEREILVENYRIINQREILCGDKTIILGGSFLIRNLKTDDKNQKFLDCTLGESKKLEEKLTLVLEAVFLSLLTGLTIFVLLCLMYFKYLLLRDIHDI